MAAIAGLALVNRIAGTDTAEPHWAFPSGGGQFPEKYTSTAVVGRLDPEAGTQYAA